MNQPNQSIQDAKITGMMSAEHDSRKASDVDFAAQIHEIRSRLGAVEDVVVSLQGSVTDNTTLTTGIAGDTAELLDLFRSVKGGFKVMGWLGTFAKWLAGIAAAFAAIYAFVQNMKGH